MNRYRPDIDGLRAIAVLLVVAFHLDLALPRRFGTWLGLLLHRPAGFVSLFPKGGYIGVDIFFVISGFLITGILLRAETTGWESVLTFYERRIRRIAPALAALLLFTTGAAFVGLLPSELSAYSKSALAAAFSYSNFYFLHTVGYFDAPAAAQPLLHTWSLAVEEQFYLVFPLLILALRRYFPRGLKACVLTCALVSFVLGAFMVRSEAAAAFYLPTARAWELLMGSLLALEIIRCPRSTAVRNVAALAGLGLIAYAGFRFSVATVFPGPAALLPCLGSVLVLATGAKGPTVVSRLLSWRPVAFIGLISYSLYLWHWPLLLINRYEYLPGIHLPTPWLFALILTAAVLSWRFVEQPFRRRTLLKSRRQVFTAAIAFGAVFAAWNLWSIDSRGFRSRFDTPSLHLNDVLLDSTSKAHWGPGCFASPLVPLAASCLVIRPGVPNVLLFGDSHAAHLWLGLTTAYPQVNFLEATGSNCKPLLFSKQSGAPFCRQLTQQLFDSFLPENRQRLNRIVLSAMWNAKDAEPLHDTADYLRRLGIPLTVVGPIVAYDQPLPRLLWKMARTGDPAIAARHTLTVDEYAALDALLAQAVAPSAYVSLRTMLCPAGMCRTLAAPGLPLQSDAMHLTDEGSLLVGRLYRNGDARPIP